ncbi:MAG: hypothetical protein U1E65_23825 [Myxococcota bacterium]
MRKLLERALLLLLVMRQERTDAMRLCAALVFVLSGCGGAAVSPDAGLDAAAEDASSADGAALDPPYLSQMTSAADYATLSSTSAEGIKYLAPVPGKQAPSALDEPLYFQNMRRFSWHLLFLQSFPALAQLSYSTYVSLVLSAHGRVLYGGAVRLLPGFRHPLSNRRGIVSFDLYTEPGAITDQDVIAAHAILASGAPGLAPLLAFAPDPSTQGAWAAGAALRLRTASVAIASLESPDQRPELEVYAAGETYGWLVLGGPSTGPHDVLVTAGPPNAAGTLAALITSDAHPANDAVNLALASRGAPSLRLGSAAEDQAIAFLRGAPVHLVAAVDRLVLEPVRAAEVEAYWAR